ncbi:hypothetical protein MHYP_G00192540 [Metynnis hypsauchen]
MRHNKFIFEKPAGLEEELLPLSRRDILATLIVRDDIKCSSASSVEMEQNRRWSIKMKLDASNGATEVLSSSGPVSSREDRPLLQGKTASNAHKSPGKQT